jgi:hypothetical protein
MASVGWLPAGWPLKTAHGHGMKSVGSRAWEVMAAVNRHIGPARKPRRKQPRQELQPHLRGASEYDGVADTAMVRARVPTRASPGRDPPRIRVRLF